VPLGDLYVSWTAGNATITGEEDDA
jgi:hypothetical protein